MSMLVPIEPGAVLLHYRLVERLGAGGMGVVWKALDTTLDREVAIKILPETFANDPERLARFEREAKLLASINHPNVAGVYGGRRGALPGCKRRQRGCAEFRSVSSEPWRSTYKSGCSRRNVSVM